jgi:predicted RNA-binding Zn ribbon-like protein
VLFAHDTTAALMLAADLVNSNLVDSNLAGSGLIDSNLVDSGLVDSGLIGPGLLSSDALNDVAALDAFLDEHQVEPRRPATAADLDAVRALRSRLRAIWQATATEPLAELVNDLLRDSGARPRLTDHGGGWGWHLHVTGPDAALVHRIGAQVGFAVADLVRLRETGRLRRCEAPDCEAVFVDLSKNRSRRYCDTGNCGNRQHVAAYRERRARRDLGGGDGGEGD